MIDKTKVEATQADVAETAPVAEVPTPAKPVVVDPVAEKITVESLQEQIVQLKALVEATADKNKISEYEEKVKDKTVKTVKVSEYNGKIILAWSKMLSNKVQKVNGVWTEDQTTELTYIDDSKEIVNYYNWQNAKMMVPAVVVSSTTSDVGRIVYALVTEDGTKFSIDQKFVN